MIRTNSRTVVLNDTERVIQMWHSDLMDKGLSPADAVMEIDGACPDDPAHPLTAAMQDLEFRDYLLA